MNKATALDNKIRRAIEIVKSIGNKGDNNYENN